MSPFFIALLGHGKYSISFNFIFIFLLSTLNNNIMFSPFLDSHLWATLCIILTWWLSSSTIWVISSEFVHNTPLFSVSVLILTLLCEYVFLLLISLHFYILFESTLLIMIFIMITWAPNPERLSATTCMSLYMIISSLPLLCLIISYPGIYLLPKAIFIFSAFPVHLTPLLLLPFLTKIPVFSIHLWLPKAHVEAPTMGSMFLASILLKLGLVGVYRFVSFIPLHMVSPISSFILLGGVLSSFICISLLDLKMIVAFSSIIHMALPASVMMYGTLSSSHTGLFILLGHGITSPFMFYLVPKFYTYSSSRSILINNGLLTLSPLLVLLWGYITLLNLPAPPFISFMGEIFIFFTLISHSFSFVLMMMFMVMYSVIICCYLYSSLIHSKPLFHTPTPPLSCGDLGIFSSPLYLTLLLLGGLGLSLLP